MEATVQSQVLVLTFMFLNNTYHEHWSAATTHVQHVVKQSPEVPLLQAESYILSRLFIIRTNLPVC